MSAGLFFTDTPDGRGAPPDVGFGAQPGANGQDGNGIKTIEQIPSTYDLQLTLNDGRIETFPLPPGPVGRDGITPEFVSGDLTYGAANAAPKLTLRRIALGVFACDLVLPVTPNGAVPWQTPPAPWSALTVYTATAPASVVTIGGATYVCSTSHTSTTSFDATKFTLIAAAGTAGTPATASDIRTGTDTTKYVPSKPLFDAHAFVALTDAATIAVDFATGINFRVTLGGNRTLGAPTNLKDGQSGIIRVKQDATGSRTIAFNSAYKFPGASVPTLSTAANAIDRFAYIVTNDGSSNIVECTALEKAIG